MVKRMYPLMVLILAMMLAGCGGDHESEPNAIQITGAKQRAALLGTTCSVQVTVPGKTQKTMLGGKKETSAVGVAVRCEIVEQPEGAGAALEETVLTTNHGGSATFKVKVGTKPGLYTLRFFLPEYAVELDPLTVTILGGIKMTAPEKDGHVGTAHAEPVRIYAESAPGVPAAGVEVAFETIKDAKIIRADDKTSKDGVAEAFLKLGKKSGRETIGVQILSAPWNTEGRPIQLKANVFALDWVSLAIQVLGGLAIFIFGMRQMSDGLALVAGNRLKSILNFLTRNRFLAVFAGLLTTGLIQSSSACTVMVIGFVNAGLMHLRQAIGVIMGSNIGTTVTAQMLSFKLNKLALPAIFIGVVVTLACKRQKSKFWAQILIGFGLLFFGMQFMGAPLKHLKDSTTIVSFFSNLSCHPVDGVIPFGMLLKAVAVGTAMTMIVQSSSASIGLLLAMAGAGLLDVYTATAVLLGDNIGTTITAVLASIGSTVTAKRTACAHVLFNMIGVTAMMCLFYLPWNGHPVFMELVDKITPGDPYRGENLTRFLANAHSLFNISCTVAFIWFVAIFAKACQIIVPGKGTEEEAVARLLDPHLLATPGIALGQAWAEVGVMLKKGHEAHATSFKTLIQPDASDWDSIAETIRENERQVDNLQTAINSYIIHLSQEALTEEQSQVLPHLLHAVNDAERIGDHSMHLLRLSKRRRKQNLELEGEAQKNLNSIHATLEEFFAMTTESLEHPDRFADQAAAQERISRSSEVYKLLKRQIKDARKAYEVAGGDTRKRIPSNVIFVDTLQNLQRVSAHLNNIIQALLKQHPNESE